jgi:integrase
MENVKAPGLKWRKLAGGHSPVWVADEADVARGYAPKTVNLRHLADQPDMLRAKCAALQADMLLWRTGYRSDPMQFDGTVKSLLRIYQCHEFSPYRSLKPGTLVPYNHYLGKLEGHIGTIRIHDISGVDIVKWHRVWSDEGRYLSAAAMARAVLEAALSFGAMLRLDGCADLVMVVREARKKLPNSRPRTSTATADQVVAARRAAHQNGRPSSALAYALAFETTLRLWDAIGQWFPLDWREMSDVIDAGRGMKWFGVRWEDVGADMVLRYQPSKTEGTTGAVITYPLSKAPMVIEELAHWPQDRRAGPMVRSEETGLPWRAQVFRQRWSVDRKTANLPSSLWARDLRASGITEGRASDVSTDDAAKVAGHSDKATTARVYDRAVLEAADRFADARIRGRERSGNGPGNVR